MRKGKSTFIGLGLAVAALAFWLTGLGTAYAAIPGGTLDPSVVTKYASPLVKPPVMPTSPVPAELQQGNGKKLKIQMGKNADYYEIAVRQFQQQILPIGMPMTTVWSYGPANEFNAADNSGLHVTQGGHYFYPAFTIEAKWNRPTRVKWINELKDAPGVNAGNYLPHVLKAANGVDTVVDPTLHWANPPGGPAMRDMRPTFGSTPGGYNGPVPIVTHVHGAHVEDISDGYAEEWWLPAAANIPGGFADTGTWYDFFKPRGEAAYGQTWTPGSAVFQYPNSQRATTLWYHDHTLGMTRLNVYAGPAGFWLVRGGPDDMVLDAATNLPAVLPGPAPGKPNLPFGDYYEIPIAIQDRSFNDDGSLFFPDSREFFDGFAGPFIPTSDISPIWNPEFFGNMMVVNGQTWPVLNVEQRRYRFRFLNGCNSRFLILQLATDGDLATVGIDDGVWNQEPGAFWQIGAEGGFLPAPVQSDQLIVALAERADVIMDFTGYAVGTELYLVNVGPDEPFGGGTPGVEFDPSDPASTGQVMKFVVGPPKSADLSTPPNQLILPAITPVVPTSTRQVSLNEEDSAVLADVGPRAAVLGTVNNPGPLATGNHLLWMDAISENPALGASETWEIYNFTMDAHPIHVHLVQFQVVGRQPISGVGTSVAGQNTPLAAETGFKDTVIAYPDEITTIKATFDMTGLYVWHCHIVDHEDNEMMRPYFVGTDAATKQPYIDHATAEGETLF